MSSDSIFPADPVFEVGQRLTVCTTNSSATYGGVVKRLTKTQVVVEFDTYPGTERKFRREDGFEIGRPSKYGRRWVRPVSKRDEAEFAWREVDRQMHLLERFHRAYQLSDSEARRDKARVLIDRIEDWLAISEEADREG